jgi:hypothetical protein
MPSKRVANFSQIVYEATFNSNKTIMRRNLLTTIGSLLLSISAFAYSGGNGTEAKFYLTSSKADMQELANIVNGGNKYSGKYFHLTRDLTSTSDTITTVFGNSSDIRYLHTAQFCEMFS